MSQIAERSTTMADTVSMALAELVRKAEQTGDVDFLLDGVRVLSEAAWNEASTRKVAGLVQALGLDGISKSQVSRLCETLDAEVERFRQRPLEGSYPSVWLDATFVKVRDGGRIVSMAVVVAI